VALDSGEPLGLAEPDGLDDDWVAPGVDDAPGVAKEAGFDPPGVTPGLGLGVGEAVIPLGGWSFINSRVRALVLLLLCA